MTVNPIEHLDVPLPDLEQRIAELRADARAACPNPDGSHLADWHAFLDIDPDLAGRDYTGTRRAS